MRGGGQAWGVSKSSFYGEAALQDALERAGTREEADLLEEALAAHGVPEGPWLEPGCGTGRLVAEFARRGREVLGYDREPAAVAFARHRLRGLGYASAARGDMRSFRVKRRFAAAYCPRGTFRHLASDREALAHLWATAASLLPGGLYAVGLDLTDYERPEPDEETWEARLGRRRLREVQLCLPPDRRSRRERVLQFITVGSGRRARLRQWSYELRSYDAAQWRALLARSPLRLAGVFDGWGRPRPLDASTRHALFILALRGPRSGPKRTRTKDGRSGPL